MMTAARPPLPIEAPAPSLTPVTDAGSGRTQRASYADILQSAVLIGGSMAFNVATNVVRTKAMALLLGPTGIGLISLYGSITDLARSIAGMGVGSSGVRQIAEAVASGDAQRISRTATVLRRLVLALGLVGSAALFICAPSIAIVSFGDASKSTAVALLSLVVLLALFADGQAALMWGTRRIADLARMSMLTAVLSMATSIPIVYFAGEAGVAPALVAIALGVAVTAWWYGRKVETQPVRVSAAEMRRESASLLRLGLAFMASGILAMSAAYATRIITLHELGLGAAGLYQAAWSVGGLYVGMIRQAMGADFYPRLVGVANDNGECNRLVNEQTHVSLLLAGPGVLATLVLAPLVLSVFYTAHFAGAVDVLRWICLGVALRVICWPMGFIIIAKNSQLTFVATELAWTVATIGATWYCVPQFGLAGAGIAAFAANLFQVLMVYPTARRLSGFRWSRAAWRTGLAFAALTAVVFIGFQCLSAATAMTIGIAAVLGSGLYAAHALVTLVPPEQIPARVQRLLDLWRRRSTAANHRSDETC